MPLVPTRDTQPTLPPVRVVGYDTQSMTQEQYAATIDALAALITAWRDAVAIDAARREGSTPTSGQQ